MENTSSQDNITEPHMMSPSDAAAAMQGIALTQALSLAMQNAVAAQQQSQMVQIAMLSVVCKKIASVQTQNEPATNNTRVPADNTAPKRTTTKPKTK